MLTIAAGVVLGGLFLGWLLQPPPSQHEQRLAAIKAGDDLMDHMRREAERKARNARKEWYERWPWER